jgi:hypothetical protein
MYILTLELQYIHTNNVQNKTNLINTGKHHANFIKRNKQLLETHPQAPSATTLSRYKYNSINKR